MEPERRKMNFYSLKFRTIVSTQGSFFVSLPLIFQKSCTTCFYYMFLFCIFHLILSVFFYFSASLYNHSLKWSVQYRCLCNQIFLVTFTLLSILSSSVINNFECIVFYAFIIIFQFISESHGSKVRNIFKALDMYT